MLLQSFINLPEFTQMALFNLWSDRTIYVNFRKKDGQSDKQSAIIFLLIRQNNVLISFRLTCTYFIYLVKNSGVVRNYFTLAFLSHYAPAQLHAQ